MNAAEATIKNNAIQQALVHLVRAHRTEFESLVTKACTERGLRYDSDWLDRYYRGM